MIVDSGVLNNIGLIVRVDYVFDEFESVFTLQIFSDNEDFQGICKHFDTMENLSAYLYKETERIVLEHHTNTVSQAKKSDETLKEINEYGFQL
jgi:hypothetical protein